MVKEVGELLELVGHSIEFKDGKVSVSKSETLRNKIQNLVDVSTLGSGAKQGWARYLVRLSAQEMGIYPASIHEFYLARGRGEIKPTFTVPAINLRVLSFDAARAAFQAALSVNASAIIFEIARSEMGYTAQKPAEFTTNILAAAIAEKYSGPVFVQGDHFQVSAKRYASDPKTELKAIEDLIREAIPAGFYNIDVDCSTLVDVSLADINEQQKLNVELSSHFTKFIRDTQPKDVCISIGGEIGEVGGKNSTEEELDAYLLGYQEAIGGKKPELVGLSKISIQTGTSHGGVVLPDGTIAKVNVDFETLRNLSRASCAKYGLGGAVQHGASTLPDDAFGKFVEFEALEVHLATNFMNMFYEILPPDLRNKIYQYLDLNFAGERKAGMTDEQFYYKTRKNGIGPFKVDIYQLPEKFHEEIRKIWKDKFTSLFIMLGLEGSRNLVEKYVKPVVVSPKIEDFLGSDYVKEDVSDLAD